ncbi:helix-turn-helix domain-containing protein [Streptomyces sp. NPDC052114]|uniref:helix-turn-helix domain-containing protein n=1 Tax=unclassified Streptomyces TaxID=2593676 RepID=UPI003440C9AC
MDHAPGTRLTGDARTTAQTKATELYLAGCTIRSVAAQIGRSYGTARALLLEAGVQLRPTGGDTRKAAR